jgi:uroporphyrin-III C-methyltransferase
MRPGLVSLVGAGPGDPELLTMRAVARLQAADLVLYDALVDPAALRHAPRARRAFVGKRAGRHSVSQQTIERVMIRRALAGERIVRLKSGDPFVFGRGAEEALALAAAGVPCEIVPGVSAATAAPALCGIPLTHRGLSTGFLVVSGHSEAAFAPALRSIAPGAATIVAMMALASRERIATILLSHGWDAEMPAAVLLAASTADACSWRGSLGTLARCELPDVYPEAPGLLVIGATVGIASAIEAIAARRDEARAIGSD